MLGAVAQVSLYPDVNNDPAAEVAELSSDLDQVAASDRALLK